MGTSHEYTTCDDPDCHKFPCKVYKQGKEDGTEIGRQVGFAEGFAEGASAVSGG